MKVVFKVTGTEELIRKLGPSLVAGPSRRFLTRAAITVQGKARREAPVDRGRLRNSIAYEIDGATIPRWAKVGTNVHYAPFVHDGTRPHFPPPAALEGWSRRHGFPPGGGFLVARAISKRGTKARPFLTDAMQQSEGQIRGLVVVMAREIEHGAAA